MPEPTEQQRKSIERYLAFWKREPVDRPVLAFGQPYPAKHLSASRDLQLRRGVITPGMVEPEPMLPAYDELVARYAALPGDTFYTPMPLNGFPWIEAMWGCEVVASGQGFSALHFVEDMDGLEKLAPDLDSPWVKRYLQFLDCLGAHFRDKRGVGQPIFRGIADLLAAVMGPENVVYAMTDEPERIKAFIRRATDFYVMLYREQMRRIPPFLGGYQIGFYDIWAPEPCLWLQDDNLVLFSPEMYKEFFLDFVAAVTAITPYNLIHLHPVCFHQLDALLDIPTLGVVEVNREMTEADFPALLPALQKIQSKKLLDVQGILTGDDFKLLADNLSVSGLQLKCLTENLDEVPELHRQFRAAFEK